MRFFFLIVFALSSPGLVFGQFPPPYRKLTPNAGTLDIGTTAFACQNQTAPATPPSGQIMYCKSGAGWCAKDAGGSERCTGSGGGGGSSAFNDITSGTNVSAAMVVGTGATLSTSGSGTIAATTAGALAANPTDCSANQYATTIAASGNLTCSQVDFTQLSGSATDAQVPDTITASNYVLKAGDTMTGNLLIDNAQELRLGEADGSGTDYTGFNSAPRATPLTLTWNINTGTCTGDGNGGALTVNGSNEIVCSTDDGGAGGGGDSITVDGAATVDPNFDDGGDINFTYSAPNITATIKSMSSATLAGILTDETGSSGGGLAVFNRSPAILNALTLTNAAAPAVLTVGGVGHTQDAIYRVQSSGDAFVHYAENSPATDWAAGIDDSDSASWKLSVSAFPGTNDVFVCTTAGACSFPDTDGLTVTGALTASGGVVGNLTGNADTATALAANPTDCGANSFATTIAANGNLTCATPVLGTDTNGNYIASLTSGTGLTGFPAAGESATGTPALSYTATLAGNPALNADECVFSTDGTGGGILCEGAADTIEGLLVWNPTTSDRTLTLPDATDTLVGRDTTDTLTNKTLAAANNVIDADTAVALAANPTDCSANQFATTIAANGNLTCAALVDADIPNTITLDNITQITTRSHASLQNLSADDHTQYLLLAGRSGGQTAIGGTAASNNLTLQSTSNGTKGSLIFDDAMSLWPNVTAGNRDVMTFNPSLSITAAGQTYQGLDWSPSLTFSGSGEPGAMQLIRWGGTITTGSVNPSAAAFMDAIISEYTTTSSTNGVAPWFPDTIFDAYTGQLVGNGTPGAITATGTRPLGFLWAPTFKATAGADFTIPYMSVVARNINLEASGSAATNSRLRIPIATAVYDQGVNTPTETGGGQVLVTDLTTVYAENRTKPTNTTRLSLINTPQNTGSGIFNLYFSGTAPSVMTGDLRIGDTTAPTHALELTAALGSTSDTLQTLAFTGTGTGVTSTGIYRGFQDLLGFTLSTTLGTYLSYDVQGTIIDTNGLSLMETFRHNPTISRTTGGTGMTGTIGFHSSPKLQVDADLDLTSGSTVGFSHSSSYAVSGGGTPTLVGVTDTGLDLATAVGASTTVATRKGINFADATGSGAVTTQIAMDVASLTKATTSMTLRSAGAATMRHEGAVSIGVPIATAPAARLEVQEATVGNEVLRLDSLATNDDPTIKTFQCRLATTDATQTTCGSTFAVASGRAMRLRAMVVAHCTGGASCTANQSAGYTIEATCRNNAGTTATATGGPTQTAVHEDTGGWDATIDCDDTTDTARLRLTGAGTTNITWHATIETMDVGT